ncbi:ammonium transporter [Okeania sp. SIO1I7]|uniref:ammonium transporter n=1 Tax=Okeania sp. SIO1I7 TaxID=2607772 RepID=UPI0013F7FD54|nr:hypothetical protein [Okeania sp. SIO1I7]NET26327.1 hypothetical protein [Okeania sp. SIO1I7]
MQADPVPLDIIFILFCAILVILMQLGFALLEAGLLPAKHTVSIIFKNFADFGASFIAFFFFGYWILKGFDNSLHPFNIIKTSELGNMQNAKDLVDFIYKGVFAATAATICSGAIAGRMKLSNHLIMSSFISGIIYPLSGLMLWGIFDELFKDYAGSVVVHATGGAAALAATLLIGSRPVRERRLPAHNVPLATTGVFLLLIGWYGFNMGSTKLSVGTPEGLNEIALVAINTTLAATVSMMVTIFLSWLNKIPRLTIAINGLLGGLVGITAAPDVAMTWYPFFVGGVCGWLVFSYSKSIIENKFSSEVMDDPVGAVVVHLVCGVAGGSAVGIIKFFEMEPDNARNQIAISVLAPIFVFVSFTIFLFVLHKLVASGRRPRLPRNQNEGLFAMLGILNRLRSEDSEIDRGLDLANHQETAYDIPSPLETPQLFKQRIDALFIQYIQKEKKEPFLKGEISPLIEYARSHFTYKDAAGARNFPDEASIRVKANYPPFNVALESWLGEAFSLVERYFKLYGDVLKINDDLVEDFKYAIDELEGYRFRPKKNRESFFNQKMNEVIKQLWHIRTIANTHNELTQESVGNLTYMSNEISKLKEEIRALKGRNS